MLTIDWRIEFFRRAFLRHAPRRYALMLILNEAQRRGQKYMVDTARLQALGAELIADISQPRWKVEACASIPSRACHSLATGRSERATSRTAALS